MGAVQRINGSPSSWHLTCVGVASVALAIWGTAAASSVTTNGPKSSGTIGRVLNGESTVKTASFFLVLLIGKASDASTGTYSFETATGQAVEKEPGGHFWVMLMQGATMYWPTAEFKQLMGFNSTKLRRTPEPVIKAPWVSRTFGTGRRSAVADLLAPTFSVTLILPSPMALVKDLQRRLMSEASLGLKVLNGARTTEYRLVLRGSGILNPQFAQPLGPSHPMFIWVNQSGRLAQLSTTVPGPPKITLTLGFSAFNRPAVVHFPPAREVETWTKIWAQWQKLLKRQSH